MRKPKDWRNREKKIMRENGVKPQPLSGAGWIKKEDGENENLLMQLKSTEAMSYTLKLADVSDLVKHAFMSGKIPVFVIDFAVSDLQLLCIRSQDIEEFAHTFSQHKQEGKKEAKETVSDLSDQELIDLL